MLTMRHAILLLPVILGCSSPAPVERLGEVGPSLPAPAVAESLRLAFDFDSVVAYQDIHPDSLIIVVRVTDSTWASVDTDFLGDSLLTVARWIIRQPGGTNWRIVSISWSPACPASEELGCRMIGVFLQGDDLKRARKTR